MQEAHALPLSPPHSAIYSSSCSYFTIMCPHTRQGLRYSAPHPAIYASSCHYYYSTICVLAYYLHTSCILVQKAERYCSSRTCVKKKWKKRGNSTGSRVLQNARVMHQLLPYYYMRGTGAGGGVFLELLLGH